MKADAPAGDGERVAVQDPGRARKRFRLDGSRTGGEQDEEGGG
ncbi:MAG: hypothetical protein OXE57_10315 [Alphaproteobacteria bacterium]|nr:hypothetical protein [Alphaproteobacteria bacterium]